MIQLVKNKDNKITNKSELQTNISESQELNVPLNNQNKQTTNVINNSQNISENTIINHIYDKQSKECLLSSKKLLDIQIQQSKNQLKIIQNQLNFQVTRTLTSHLNWLEKLIQNVVEPFQNEVNMLRTVIEQQKKVINNYQNEQKRDQGIQVEMQINDCQNCSKLLKIHQQMYKETQYLKQQSEFIKNSQQPSKNHSKEIDKIRSLSPQRQSYFSEKHSQPQINSYRSQQQKCNIQKPKIELFFKSKHNK